MSVGSLLRVWEGASPHESSRLSRRYLLERAWKVSLAVRGAGEDRGLVTLFPGWLEMEEKHRDTCSEIPSTSVLPRIPELRHQSQADVRGYWKPPRAVQAGSGTELRKAV